MSYRLGEGWILLYMLMFIVSIQSTLSVQNNLFIFVSNLNTTLYTKSKICTKQETFVTKTITAWRERAKNVAVRIWGFDLKSWMTFSPYLVVLPQRLSVGHGEQGDTHLWIKTQLLLSSIPVQQDRNLQNLFISTMYITATLISYYHSDISMITKKTVAASTVLYVFIHLVLLCTVWSIVIVWTAAAEASLVWFVCWFHWTTTERETVLMQQQRSKNNR